MTYRTTESETSETFSISTRTDSGDAKKLNSYPRDHVNVGDFPHFQRSRVFSCNHAGFLAICELVNVETGVTGIIGG